ncbi:MAG: sigma-70 family RNA polymerase sigma factor [Bacteroidota bacterium]
MIKAINQGDEKILKGIAAADNESVRQLYDMALPAVIRWVRENNGSEADARDIFQEAVLALFRKLEGGELVLSCTLKSFVRIMCRNLWLTRIRNRKKFAERPMEEVELVSLDEDLIQQLEQSEKRQLFFKHFDALEGNCRQILQWFFDKVPLKQIAQQLDTSESYIKKRKFICKERLVKAVQQDPKFAELKN